MGTWGLNILDTDTSNGVYQDFMEMYAIDTPIKEINKSIFEENQCSIHDKYDCNNFWFGLALAQWETMTLEDSVYNKVEEIITSGNDLKIWEELDASSADLKRRKKELNKFLVKISKVRKRPIAKKSIKIEPIFKKGDCLVFKLNNGNYGGCVILESVNDLNDQFGYGKNLVAVTRMNSTELPTENCFFKQEILKINYCETTVENARLKIIWYTPDLFKKNYRHLFTKVGQISVERKYCYSDNEFWGGAGWHMIKEYTDKQFEHEKLGTEKPYHSHTIKSAIEKKIE